VKYVIRRALLGLISIPFVAGAYTFLFITLLAISPETDVTVSESYHNGIIIGITNAVIITFYPQLNEFLKKFTDQ
jgi:hypothetical protein